MSTDELPSEKRIDDELTIPENPSVHPESMPNDCEPDETHGEPPQTRLLLTGFAREEITADFLDAIHDLADDHDLPLESISVGQSDDE